MGLCHNSNMKVILIAAITADGFIGRDKHHTADWTPTEDKVVFKELTKAAGVMVMGSRTYDTIGRPLPGRKTVVYTSRPEEYQADNLQATDQAPAALLDSLQEEGFSSVAICGGQQIYDMFMNAGVVTDIYLTVVPTLFGDGVRLFSSTKDQQLSLVESRQLNASTILLHYSCQ